MKNFGKTSAIALSVLLGTTALAHAQSLINADPVNERVDDIIEETEDKFELSDDDQRFGNATMQQGWRGSVYASADLLTGNTDTFDISVGTRVSNRAGAWNQTISMAYDYAEANGAETKNELFTLYDVNRTISGDFYGYGLARAENNFTTNSSDLFAGVGVGYRIFNTPDLAWRVQAGPGYRINGLSLTGTDIDEAGVSASSRLYYKFSDSVFLTNDTDIIWSDSNTLVSNDIGVNVRLSGPLSIRAGVKTDYNTDPGVGRKNTDTNTGLALVYAFN